MHVWPVAAIIAIAIAVVIAHRSHLRRALCVPDARPLRAAQAMLSTRQEAPAWHHVLVPRSTASYLPTHMHAMNLATSVDECTCDDQSTLPRLSGSD